MLRCRTEIHGSYFNNGQKGEISDVQVSTVFPDKQVQAGIWSGLDEPSGATYKVSCRALVIAHLAVPRTVATAARTSSRLAAEDRSYPGRSMCA